MKKKRAVILALSLLVSILLSACGGAETVTVLREWEAADEKAESDFFDARSFRVGMVADIGGIHDESFNQSAWEGLQELEATTGCTVSYLESVTMDDFAGNFAALAEDGYQLVWGIGYDCADAMLEAAERYPDVHFAIIDNTYDEPPENVTGVTFRAGEASFLVGYIAAAVSTTGTIGFVGGISGVLIDEFQYGYQAGAAYADKLLGKHTEVLIRYVGSWLDAETGHALAEELYDLGCDVIYHAAGGSGMGVIDSARERGLFAIGVDRDQSSLAPKNVLTSALKRVDVAIIQVSRDFMEGREIGGVTFLLGLAEGAVGIPEGHTNYSDDVYDAALRAADDIISGELTPPPTSEAFEIFAERLAQTS